MNHGFVLNDGAANIRSSYFPVSAVVVRDEPSRYHREEYYTGNGQPWSSSSNVNNSNHRVGGGPRSTGGATTTITPSSGGNSRSPTSRRHHPSSTSGMDQRRASHPTASGSARSMPSYMAATASFQRKHQPEDDEGEGLAPHDLAPHDDAAGAVAGHSSDHRRGAAVRGADTVVPPPGSHRRSRRPPGHGPGDTTMDDDGLRTPPPRDSRRPVSQAPPSRQRDSSRGNNHAARQEYAATAGAAGGTSPSSLNNDGAEEATPTTLIPVAGMPLMPDDVGTVSAASSSTTSASHNYYDDRHAPPPQSSYRSSGHHHQDATHDEGGYRCYNQLGRTSGLYNNGNNVPAEEEKEEVVMQYWIVSEAERRDSIDGEEDLSWILLMEDFMDGVAGVLCAPPPAAEGLQNPTTPSTAVATTALHEAVPMRSVATPSCQQVEEVVVVEAAADAPSQSGSAAREAQQHDTVSQDDAADSPPGIAPVDRLIIPPPVAHGPISPRAAVNAKQLVNMDTMPPELQQYLMALHFQSVALSAEVKRVSETHQILQSSLVSAQVEIMRLRGSGSNGWREAPSAGGEDVGMHVQDPSEQTRSGGESGSGDEVPIHPALLVPRAAPPPPPMENPHDYTTVEEALAVEGTGNVVKSIYHLLSYPLQCCIRKPSSNDE